MFFLEVPEFQRRTGLDLTKYGGSKVRGIVALRELKVVRHIQLMPTKYLDALLRAIPLVGSTNIQDSTVTEAEGDVLVFPYQQAVFQHGLVDPRNLLMGQTFVQRPKYNNLLEKFNGLFAEFCGSRGFAQCSPMLVFGQVEGSDDLVLAHYLPPIVEMHENRQVLMDGLHRNFITMGTGGPLEAITIVHVGKQFPSDVHDWGNVTPVDTKPDRAVRYNNLKPELFRDLKYVGIDG